MERDEIPSLQRALEMNALNVKMRERLAFLLSREQRSEEALELLEEAVRLEPYRSSAMLELARLYEGRRTYVEAERWLLRARSVDRLFGPVWALSNYYLRRGDMPKFWEYARPALSVSSDGGRALLALSFRAAPDVERLLRELTPTQDQLRTLLDLLITQGSLVDAEAVVGRLQVDPKRDQSLLLRLCEAEIEGKRVTEAAAIWRKMN
ncbi:MAG TPA: tetratricopeptide repeat protein, partial [Bryobacteraceae bacterium]|nr:tetratricopeptide repeat protein [Bryobacteraceae bacterium]